MKRLLALLVLAAGLLLCVPDAAMAHGGSGFSGFRGFRNFRAPVRTVYVPVQAAPGCGNGGGFSSFRNFRNPGYGGGAAFQLQFRSGFAY